MIHLLLLTCTKYCIMIRLLRRHCISLIALINCKLQAYKSFQFGGSMQVASIRCARFTSHNGQWLEPWSGSRQQHNGPSGPITCVVVVLWDEPQLWPMWVAWCSGFVVEYWTREKSFQLLGFGGWKVCCFVVLFRRAKTDTPNHHLEGGGGGQYRFNFLRCWLINNLDVRVFNFLR